MKKGIATVSLIISIILLVACRRVESVVWSSYSEIPPEGWDPIHVLGFSPWPEDSVVRPQDRYSLVLSLRFPSRRTIPPLSIVVRQEDNTRFLRADTLVIHPVPPATSPFGQGAYGVYETSDTIARGITLSDGYLVELQNLSPSEDTAGLIDVGLTLFLEGNHSKIFKL